MSSTSSQDVAAWMQSRVTSEGELYQEEAAYTILEQFGEEHVYTNENGNLAISKDVLAAFRKLTSLTVVWVRHDRRWRLREVGDEGRGVDW